MEAGDLGHLGTSALLPAEEAFRPVNVSVPTLPPNMAERTVSAMLLNLKFATNRSVLLVSI